MSDRDMSSHESNSVYNEVRLEGQLTDAVVKVEDTEFQIHKIVLCDCSPYFRALFTRRSTPDKKLFEIPGLSPDMMQLIIEFAYTGIVSVTEDNVQELLLTADQFNVMDIIQACSDFLEERLCPQNCIGMWQFTNICLSSKLQHNAYRYIIDNFEEVVSSEEFQHLSAQELSDILESKDLNVREESTVFDTVHQWIAHEPEGRKEHLLVLLSKVRLALTSEDYVRMNVMSNELVNSNAECLQMVEDAMQINDWMITVHIRLSTVERYSPETNQWSLIAPMHKQRSNSSCTTLQNKIYICGGFNGQECLQTCEYYSPETNQWTMITPMTTLRSGLGVITYADHVYAVGGFDGSVPLCSAEAYNPGTNTWHAVSCMLNPRSNFGIEIINDKLFVVRGFNGFTTASKVEYYDANTNEWSKARNMDIDRSVLSCCMVSGLPNTAKYTVPRDTLPFLQLEDGLVTSGDSKH